MPAPPLQLIDAPDAAAVMLDPTRARLLAALGRPASAADLARQVGMPRQKVNYHLRELERVGAVEFEEERRKGNCVERVVRRSARSYLVDPAILGRLGDTPRGQRDRFSWAYLVSSMGRAIADLAVLRRRADGAGKTLATLTVEAEVRFKSPAQMKAFAEEAATALAQLAARYHDERAPEGRRYRFVLGGLPVITKTEDEAAGEEAASKEQDQPTTDDEGAQA